MKFRKKVLLLALQAAVGTAVVPTGAANAILTKNLEIDPLEGEVLSRELDKEDLGADLATLVGKHVRVRFMVEVAGSGTPETPPAWGPAMIAAGHDETIDAGLGTEKVTYTPVDDALPATIYLKHDQVLHKIVDCRGSVRLTTGKRKYAYWEFDFVGLYQAPEHHAISLDPVTTAFVKPVPFRAANVEATLFAETLCLTELTANLGQTNQLWECSEQETTEMEDRKASFEAKFKEPLISDHSFYDDIDTDVSGELTYTHGTVEGNIVEFTGFHAQLTNPPKRENDGGNIVLSAGGPLARVGTEEYSIVTR